MQRGLFEGRQVGGGLVDRGAGGRSAGGVEVVAGRDLGQPAAEPLQVGFDSSTSA